MVKARTIWGNPPMAQGLQIYYIMLDAYIHYCMHKKSKEREVKFAKASVDFSNELTHNRTATAMDAELCYNAVLSTVHIIRTLNKYND